MIRASSFSDITRKRKPSVTGTGAPGPASNATRAADGATQRASALPGAAARAADPARVASSSSGGASRPRGSSRGSVTSNQGDGRLENAAGWRDLLGPPPQAITKAFDRLRDLGAGAAQQHRAAELPRSHLAPRQKPGKGEGDLRSSLQQRGGSLGATTRASQASAAPPPLEFTRRGQHEVSDDNTREEEFVRREQHEVSDADTRVEAVEVPPASAALAEEAHGAVPQAARSPEEGSKSGAAPKAAEVPPAAPARVEEAQEAAPQGAQSPEAGAASGAAPKEATEAEEAPDVPAPGEQKQGAPPQSEQIIEDAAAGGAAPEEPAARQAPEDGESSPESPQKEEEGQAPGEAPSKEPEAKAAEEEERAADTPEDVADPKGSAAASRFGGDNSWLNGGADGDTADKGRVEEARAVIGAAGGFKDFRELWAKRASPASSGFSGTQNEQLKSRLSKTEAEVALQRLVTTSGTVDFDGVRQMRKLINDMS